MEHLFPLRAAFSALTPTLSGRFPHETPPPFLPPVARRHPDFAFYHAPLHLHRQRVHSHRFYPCRPVERPLGAAFAGGIPESRCFFRAAPPGAMRSADRRCSLPVRRSPAGTFAEPAGRRLHAGRVLRRVAGRSGGVGAGDHLPRPALWRHRRDGDRLRVSVTSDNPGACLCP